MATIKIDDKEYEIDDLSEEAKNQLQAIQFASQEIVRLQLKLAAMQTARNSYGRALKEVLGTDGDDDPELDLPDDIKFD